MYWIVPGIGIVKKTVSVNGGAAETIELVSYVLDTDDDGIFADDNCHDDPNPDQLDTDNDGQGDVCDDDDDGDGTLDVDDAFPLDPAEDTDTDSDGIGNNADQDDDGDQLPDSFEIGAGLDSLDPADAAADLDADGLSNLEEFLHGTDIDNPDSDGDGVSDGQEVANGRNPLVNEKAIMGGVQTILLDDE